ncbi:MAG: carboxypeptidase regulatory-like domain-containing protein [Akkermansiaceae bacterium]|nr:carboxypeptidase regulatory-like domain-containing protein [Armatimonadota bacterium]
MKFFTNSHDPARRPTLWDLIAMASVSLFFAAMLFPFYARNLFISRVFVYDANGIPAPFTRLTFKDAHGLPNYFTITDGKGESRDPLAMRFAEDVSGPYKFHAHLWNSKSPKMWVLSARGTKTLTVKDEAGEPVPGLPILLSYPPRGLYPSFRGFNRPSNPFINRNCRTDRNGIVTFPDVALCQRLEPYVGDNSFVVESIRVTTAVDWVNYDVRVARPATINGVITSTSGDPVGEIAIFAAIISNHRYKGDPTLCPTSKTDSHGRFRLTGMPPGDYALYRGDLWRSNPSDALTTKKITVRSGETKYVTLRVP